MIGGLKEIAPGIDEYQLFDDFASFSDQRADQNCKVLVAAFLADQKLHGLEEILNLLPKTECRLWILSPSENPGPKIYLWTQ